MKFFVLAAIFVAVTYGKPGNNVSKQNIVGNPWQEGQQYKYDVKSHTLAQHAEGESSGVAFNARFIIRAKTPSRLQVKLENPQYAQLHQQLSQSKELPEDLQYKPAVDLEQPFEIVVENGRVKALNLPESMSLASENLVKGLVSALQVDIEDSQEQQQNVQWENQAQFYRMEADVTGECQTLYTVSPVASEWRRELPHLAHQQDPIEITKNRDYSKCHHSVGYHFGVPEAFKWSGIAYGPTDYQFISRHATQRILAAKDGTIYKSLSISTVNVKPIMYGDQKAEVISIVELTLQEVKQDIEPVWEISQNIRQRSSLVYALTIKEQSSSSISSESSDSAYKNDDLPTENEPAYAALYLTSQTKSEGKNYAVVAQELAQEIAQQLQNPNSMPKGDALSKFNILVRVIASMSTEQLREASRNIEITNTSYNSIKSDAWMVYRDAVAQAGTMPAFQQIKSWIQSKKLQGEEAAEVFGSLATTLRYPTKDQMTQFFRLAVSDEVRSQLYLNTTALIAATKFIQLGHVNNEFAIEFYPTQMYGRLARKHDRFVLEEILPYLEQELNKAIENEDSHKAQVYIRAIGNLGHNATLNVYAPYFEGKKPSSTYLRRQMVESLAILGNERDIPTRNVLYSLLRNTGESYEVRVIAVQNIFRSIPTGAMMQAMALMTHTDPSIHVRAAIKSGIETSAGLKEPRYMDLTRVAQAALPMLTKEKLETYYSLKNFFEFHDPKDELTLRSFLTHLGSEDSTFPKELRNGWKSKAEGWNKEHYITAATSSVRKFMDYLEQLTNGEQDQQQRSNANHKYSAEKVAKLLNIQQEPDTPFEAALYMDVMFQHRFFALSEQDLQQLPAMAREVMALLAQGIDFHYTKVVNHAQVSIMFPVAMGMPFIYKYQTPALLHVQGKTKVEFDQSKKNFDQEIQFTYAKNIEGSVGFLDTLSNHWASAGVVNKVQFNIPVRVQAKSKPGQIDLQFQPLTTDQDTTLMHYSVWPYTANQKQDSQITVALDPNTKVIERSNKIATTDVEFGLANTGMQFHLYGYSYSKDYRNFASLYLGGHDLLSSLSNAAYQRDVALTQYNFKYLGKQSPNSAVAIKAVYDQKLYKNAVQQQSQEPIKATEKSETQSNSPARRSQMLDEVSSGIQQAKAQVLDLSVSFEGQQKREYVISAAIASSPVDEKTQFAVFYSRNTDKQGSSQANAAGTVRKSQSSQTNLEEALKEQPKTQLDIDVKLGGNQKIQIQANMERTKQYVDALREQPEAKQCEKQISKNNYYQPACQKMIMMANAEDQLRASVHYKDVSPSIRNFVNQAYRLARHLTFWDNEQDYEMKTPEGKIEIEADAFYLKNTFSLKIKSPSGELRVQNVVLPEYAVALSPYSPISTFARLANQFTNQQFLPHCSVDGSNVNTFSNRSYDYELSKSWHVVMLDDARNTGLKGHNQEQIVVLARKYQQNQQEIYISYQSNDGQAYEIKMQPSQQGSGPKATVNVETSSKKSADGAYNMYKDQKEQEPAVQYYASFNGDMNLVIGNERLRALYDGQRLVIFANGNRNNTRGICGQMTAEPRDDFKTPQGIVDQPQLFGAWYALNTENADLKTQQQQEEAKKNAYRQKQFYTTVGYVV